MEDLIMRANKLFYDLYSTNAYGPLQSLSYEDYRKWYDKHDDVYIILVDRRIYTRVKRQEMFNKGLHNGCFIEHFPFNTPEEVRTAALQKVKELDLMFVYPDEFKAIEQQNEDDRVAKAFLMAEQMIAND